MKTLTAAEQRLANYPQPKTQAIFYCGAFGHGVLPTAAGQGQYVCVY
jgi:hypothetical protein